MIPCIVGETGSLEVEGAGKAVVLVGMSRHFWPGLQGGRQAPQEWGRSPTAEHLLSRDSSHTPRK